MADEKDQHSDEILSIAHELFFGKVSEEHVFPYPEFSADEREMSKTMNDALKKFADDHINSEHFDRAGALPESVMKGLAELGLYGLAVPEEFGGMELSSNMYSRVFQEIASYDGSTATMLGAHQSIGYKALLNEGTDEQKKKWLPRLATGEIIAAFCLTEPSSGSDAYSIKTKAKDNNDGTYTISGQKLWITNAGTAEFYTVFCKTDHQADGEVKEKISCFILEKSMPGISFGEKEDKMGIRASETRAVYFDNVIVPKENILGELGRGFKIAMNVLNTGRLSLGTGSVGGMKKMIKLATDHAKTRKQFDRPISEFGLIQDKIAEMNQLCYSAESVVYLTTGLMKKGMKNYALESAICKIFNSECLWKVVDMATQIAGGCGYMREYPYERMMRDSRINLIFEGTNEILRCFVALMGIRGPGEDLKELGKLSDVSNALADPIKSLGVLYDFGIKRINKIVGTRTLNNCHKELGEHSAAFSSMLSDFSISVENTLFKYKKKIVDHELPQKRLAEMAIDLYVSLAVLSRTSKILSNDQVDQGKKEQVLNMANLSLAQRRETFRLNQRLMSGDLDSITKAVSEYSCNIEGYGLDVVDF